MKRYWLIVPFFLGIISIKAQSLVVNADGTHSVVISSGGNTGVIVNSNGTHSTVINSGSNVSTVVNPNGTHSTVINNGSVSTIVNPDGTHSIGVNNGPVLQVVTPDSENKTLPKPAKKDDTHQFSKQLKSRKNEDKR